MCGATPLTAGRQDHMNSPLPHRSHQQIVAPQESRKGAGSSSAIVTSARTPYADNSRLGEENASSRIISEARAYAQSISLSTPPLSGLDQPSGRKVSRPLPRPPQTKESHPSSRAEAGTHKARILNVPVQEFDAQSHHPRLRSQSASAIPALVRHPVPVDIGSRSLYGRSKVNFQAILANHRIQALILSYCSIESFLSLTGSAPPIRKLISGEIAGRWVLAQWGIRLGDDPARSWPNLSVWEGFVEGLKHDCSTYYTYDHKWRPLLSHICLSYSLIVLFLRSLPSGSLPQPPEFEDEAKPTVSIGTLPWQSLPCLPVAPTGITPNGSGPHRMPRRERVTEVVLPQPLAVKPEELPKERPVSGVQLRRRSSNGSFVSARSGSTRHSLNPVAISSAGGLPPVSFPTVKRYGFRKSHASPRSFSSISSGRPGSIASTSIHSQRPNRGPHRSLQTGPDLSGSPQIATSIPSVLPDISRLSMESDINRRIANPRKMEPREGQARLMSSADRPAIEAAFNQPAPYVPGRAPVLQVFVPPEGRWPSIEATARCLLELERCGAMSKMMFGDLIVNTAIPEHNVSRHMLLYVPSNPYKLVPLQHTCSRNGHLPAYVDAFALPPSYYQARLSPPYVIFVDLRPFAARARTSIRLATDRQDIVTASGAQMSAKRYIAVAGFEIRPSDRVVTEWCGLVTLEADGTTEGREAMIARLGHPERASPWQIVTEKSMRGSVWLRLIRLPASTT